MSTTTCNAGPAIHTPPRSRRRIIEDGAYGRLTAGGHLTTVEFRILGPLEVVRDGQPVSMTGHRERTVLCALLLNANRVVSTDRLIDVVWGESPPRTGANALQVSISRLRAVLEPDRGRRDPPTILLTQEPGYVLHIQPDDLDARRFEKLASSGRDALLRGDAEGADRLLDDALALWRGSALADFAYDAFAEGERRRLDELRLTAVEDRLEAGLALGNHELASAELEALVVEHPFRERLRAHFALALYRCDRQADALEAIDAARRTLAEELGLDPRELLTQLERAILTHDPGLDLAGYTLRTTAAAAQRTSLPARITALIGRDEAIDEIDSLVRSSRLVTLTGAAGIGKTTLAVEVARTLATSFADGTWFIDLAPISDADDVARATAEALGLDANTSRVLADGLGHGELLLVLDNCEHVVDGCAELVSDVLVANPAAKVLATSREPLRVPGELSWLVPSLPVPALGTGSDAVPRSPAVQLFVERAKAADPRFEVDPARGEIVAEVCRKLDGLPLAIELAASRVRGVDLEDLAGDLFERLSDLGPPARTVPRQQTIEAAVRWSYDLLDPDERALFERLSVFAGGFSLDSAERVCSGDGIDAERVAGLLIGLVDRSVVQHAHGRYRLLQILRGYARDRVSDDELASLRTRHLHRLADLLDEAEHQPELERRSQLSEEQPNLQDALAWSITTGDVATGLRVALSNEPWAIHDRLADQRYWLERLLGADAEVPKLLRARALRLLGGFAFMTGDWATGIDVLQGARDLYRELNDDAGAAWAHVYIGLSTWGAGRPDRAAPILQTAVEEARCTEDRYLLARALMAASLHASHDDAAHATGLAEEALALAGTQDAPLFDRAHTHETLAYCLHLCGQEARAREALRMALPLYLELQSRTCGAHCLETAAAVGARRHPDDAARLLGAAETMREGSGDVHRPWEHLAMERCRDELARLLGDRLNGNLESGRTLSFEDAASLALDVMLYSAGVLDGIG